MHGKFLVGSNLTIRITKMSLPDVKSEPWHTLF